jgi:hypothetical protein
MKMNPLHSPLQETSIRPDILRERHRFGLFLGIFAGLAFAAATWGFDAVLLSRIHAYQPWLKWMVGALVCAPAGGLAGWLSARLDKPIFSVLLWLAASAVFAWLSTVNSFRIFPSLIVQIDPEFASFMNYTVYQNLGTRTALAYMWTGIFGVIVGVLQLPLSEGAVFSASYGYKGIPVQVLMLIMGLCGVIVDNLNNEPLRAPVVSLHRVVAFAIETRGQELDPKLAREMRRSTVREIEDWLGRPYYFVVASFDRELGLVHVYANFGGDWADCTVVYNQPSFCKPLAP